MATVEQILKTSPLVSAEQYGDAYGSKISSSFGSALTSTNVGNLGKNGDENTTFLRFLLNPAQPPGAILQSWKIQVQFTADAPLGPSPLDTRLGCLIGDARWNYSAASGGFKHGYAAWHYPTSSWLPHPTADGNDVILDDVLVGDVFLGGGTGALIPIDYASSVRSFGEGYSGLDQTLTGSTAQLQTALDLQAGQMIAFAWDVYDPDDSLTGNYAQFLTHDYSAAASPTLYLSYALPDRVKSYGVALGGAVVTQTTIGSAAVMSRAGLEATVSLSIQSTSGAAVAVAGESAQQALAIVGYAIEGD